MKLLFATGNAGKLRELRQLLHGHGFELIGLDDLAERPPETEETGSTFAENATLKARDAARASGLRALADDSGLEVDALDGRPGVHSARYAGADASDAERNQKLLGELAGVPAEKRTARFRCAIAFVDPARLDAPVIHQGSCEGRILEASRGVGGFGYDPLFYVEQLGQTFAEAEPAAKNAISHRGKAMRAMARYLTSLPTVG